MEEKDEQVVEETTQETGEQVEETPQTDESKFESAGDDSVMKVDLSKPPKIEKEDAVQESETEKVDVQEPSGTSEEVVEEKQEEEKKEEVVLEEITGEEVEEVAEEVSEAIKESMETGEPLPENIQKLMDFMEETGGDLNDYVKLNQDYSKLEDQDLLYEYYKQTKPHLNQEEINFLMEDNFSFDEDVDDERDIRRKKLALKEQVASAKSHLDGQKSKYYEEIKAGSRLTPEQQKAVNFFNRYNKESEATQKTVKKNTDIFTQKTNNVFNDKFKGFEYNVGDKKFRFNVKDASEIKEAQSDINNFVKKFLNKKMKCQTLKGIISLFILQ